MRNIDTFSGASMLAAAVAIAALAACERHDGLPAGASPSAKVIGTQPARPTGDPAGTTPVASNTTVVSKFDEITRKPQEGDNHSHSTEAVVTPQKADGVNHTSSEAPK